LNSGQDGNRNADTDQGILNRRCARIVLDEARKKGVIPRLLDFAPLTSLVLVSEPRTEPQFYGEQFIYARWARPLLGNPPHRREKQRTGLIPAAKIASMANETARCGRSAISLT
jgi:hypothetical protein